ncbi:elongation factor P--(R)-beta-lysine ligase [Candidatus Curculioniphilus buchneri]|uniref:elongation factor P--(R)-beta-lysine ligase n=1 Tax=Candidatus Curculioniphilus buchneri TaxID=690594 RepID=UPI00376ED59F
MSNLTNWKPSTSIINLFKRAKIIKKIRLFFNNRGFLEVETPAMSQSTVTDIHLTSFQTYFIKPGGIDTIPLYLITSPEYHMKRLLAAGSGPIFQLCRSFRNTEMGRYHNPEFTILEWYRPDYDMFHLMDELDDLLLQILDCENAERNSYQELFSRHLGINPLSSDTHSLYDVAIRLNVIEKKNIQYYDHDTLLQLLFSIVVEPNIGHDKPVFVYHFPASQAELAKLNTENRQVADRFEVYFKGVELANGFRELTDANEQYQRFIENNRKRSELNLIEQPIDKNLLMALEQGIPECSGIALGIDRLIMLAVHANQLSEVIAFSLGRA